MGYVRMKYLSLFSGAGGGDLGALLLGWKCLGYVEHNEYCCKLLEQRIKDGILEDAPIFQIDIQDWIKRGYAESYQGLVDVVSGGFPCQPFSTAARGRNNQGLDMWPEMLEVVRVIRPAHVFAENVSDAAMRRAKLDLESAGYQVRRARISAAGVGAPYRRAREWLVADDNGDGEPDVTEHEEVEVMCSVPRLAWWDSDKPGNTRVVSRIADRMDRTRAIGNGQVPAVARSAWEILS